MLEVHLPNADFNQKIDLETIIYIYCRDRRLELAKPTKSRLNALDEAVTAGRKYAIKLRNIEQFCNDPNIYDSTPIIEHVARLESFLKSFQTQVKPRSGFARLTLAKEIIAMW